MKIKIFKTAILTLTLLIAFNIVNGQASQKAIDDHKKIWNVPVANENIVNPYLHNATAADSGKIIYQKICSVCHGSGGKGDGIAAPGLSVQPANHTSDLVQAQTDGALFYELSNGHAPMPAYKTLLTEKQRWSLVNYIKSLKPKAKK